MRKQHRVILILFVVALVGGLVVAVSFSGRDKAPESSAWDRVCWDLLLKLGVFSARSNSPKEACISNLKQIEGAKATWALETRNPKTDIPTATDLYGTNAYIRDELTCPEGGTYVFGSVEQKPRCSIPGHTI